MGTELFLWILLNYGLTNIVVFGVIFEPVRNWFLRMSQSKSKLKGIAGFINELINCPMCFSTWSGIFFSLIMWSPINEVFGLSLLISWLFDGILTSGAVWALNSIIEFFEDRVDVNNK